MHRLPIKSRQSANDPIADIGGLLHQQVMGLYTIVCDYAGGTFVSQVPASDEHDAVAQWAALLKDKRTLGERSAQLAKQALVRDDGLVALDGLTGAWCWSATIEGALALVNIIRSAE